MTGGGDMPFRDMDSKSLNVSWLWFGLYSLTASAWMLLVMKTWRRDSAALGRPSEFILKHIWQKSRPNGPSFEDAGICGVSVVFRI